MWGHWKDWKGMRSLSSALCTISLWACIRSKKGMNCKLVLRNCLLFLAQIKHIRHNFVFFGPNTVTGLYKSLHPTSSHDLKFSWEGAFWWNVIVSWLLWTISLWLQKTCETCKPSNALSPKPFACLNMLVNIPLSSYHHHHVISPIIKSAFAFIIPVEK